MRTLSSRSRGSAGVRKKDDIHHHGRMPWLCCVAQVGPDRHGGESTDTLAMEETTGSTAGTSAPGRSSR